MSRNNFRIWPHTHQRLHELVCVPLGLVAKCEHASSCQPAHATCKMRVVTHVKSAIGECNRKDMEIVFCWHRSKKRKRVYNCDRNRFGWVPSFWAHLFPLTLESLVFGYHKRSYWRGLYNCQFVCKNCNITWRKWICFCSRGDLKLCRIGQRPFPTPKGTNSQKWWLNCALTLLQDPWPSSTICDYTSSCCYEYLRMFACRGQQ